MDGQSLIAELAQIASEGMTIHGQIQELNQKLAALTKRAWEIADDLNQGHSVESSGTQFEKLTKFFRSVDNHPQTIRAMLQATGIQKGSLSQILYRTHRDHFVRSSHDPNDKKKLWSLSQKGLEAAGMVRPTLFGMEGDLSESDAADCCYRILGDHENEPMSVLTMTREALKRGYSARTVGDDDSVLFSTTKSFWARLSRDDRFVNVKPFVYRLRVDSDPPPAPKAKRRIIIEEIDGDDL